MSSSNRNALIAKAAGAYLVLLAEKPGDPRIIGEGWPTSHSAMVMAEVRSRQTRYILIRGSRRKLLAVARVEKGAHGDQLRLLDRWPDEVTALAK